MRSPAAERLGPPQLHRIAVDLLVRIAAGNNEPMGAFAQELERRTSLHSWVLPDMTTGGHPEQVPPASTTAAGSA
jgi:hypothetical protein